MGIEGSTDGPTPKNEILSLDPQTIEESLQEVVASARACGGIAELVAQGELNDYPGLEHALGLIDEENRRRRNAKGEPMPPERIEAINLGAKVMALVIKTAVEKQAEADSKD